MSKILPAMLLALMLTGCGILRKPIAAVAIPRPPSEALQPCAVPPVVTGDAAGVETALIERGAAIRACEAKRAALVAGWPQ